jgi:TetR/AcrR family transcriptional regulator, transcriptional repressor for nem operon
MGRARAYDENTVLTGAMRAFRRKGYHGVSIRDLEDATGLKAGSIYNSFGDKAGLFDAAFAHYNLVVLRRRIDSFAPADVGVGGLRALFLSLLHEPNGENLGCLITNIAVELGGDEKPHPCAIEGLRVLNETFAERLLSAQREGRLPSGVAASVTAVKLLALYQGILVLIRAGHDKRALEALINDEFNQLEPAHES